MPPPAGPAPPRSARGDEEPVPVTVQWRGHRPEGPDRPSRKAALRRQLERALSSHPGLEVDWNTVSISGQTVEVQVPPGALAAIVDELSAEGLRVDVAADRQIVEE